MQRLRAGVGATAGCAALLLAGCSGPPAPEVAVPDAAVTSAPSASASASAPPTSAPTSSSPVPSTAGPSTAAPPSSSADVVVVREEPVVAPDLPAYELEVRAPDDLGVEEAAVVDAWRAFWETITTASGVPAYDDAAMGAVATDRALVDARGYVEGLVDAGQRVTGRLVVVADDVVVEGSTASVSGCSDQRDGEVDGTGAVVSLPEGPTGIRTELVREGTGWRVSLWGDGYDLCG